MQLFLLNILQSPHLLALALTLLVFLITLLLALRWNIRVLTGVLILICGLAVSLVINYYQEFRSGFHKAPPPSESAEENQKEFSQQMKQAIEDLWKEIQTEKKQLSAVMLQVQEILDSMNAEKMKLQNFIEETRERFQSQHTSPTHQTHQPAPTNETNNYVGPT